MGRRILHLLSGIIMTVMHHPTDAVKHHATTALLRKSMLQVSPNCDFIIGLDNHLSSTLSDVVGLAGHDGLE